MILSKQSRWEMASGAFAFGRNAFIIHVLKMDKGENKLRRFARICAESAQIKYASVHHKIYFKRDTDAPLKMHWSAFNES